ncbi:LGFP repeat-containing protein [Phytohabitans aurantiacus]|uniref:Uncharacterized protein n=1 Tax=Phytohabitans aurantiacus TaxID=3016789 RepID=A0ABQ5R032_9ACTN|nr:hypothetical protein [Phytohabitans aurantiacus]GLH99231.1 hypothetical protein Pa4123_45060 [Phytohabitans aurantiacus]
MGIAEIAGAQLAWWQLGFRARRAVLRAARREGAPVPPWVWDAARGWAWQVLAAPWWWRSAKAAAGSALALPALALLFQGTLGQPDWVSAGAATVAVPPLVAGWVWHNTRRARIIAGHARDLPRRRAGWRLAVALLGTALAATALAHAVARDRAARYDCPASTVDPAVHRWWVGVGGRVAVGCPVGDTRVAANGQRYTVFGDGDVLFEVPATGVARLGPAVAAAWLGAGGRYGPLGYPVDVMRGDGPVTYVDFEGGHIAGRADGPARVVLGSPYTPSHAAGGPCVRHARPCVTVAERAGGVIRLAWTAGPADAFNVSWWRVGDPHTHRREVAGLAFSLPVPVPGGRFGFAVQACDKHFLRPSTCTEYSDNVIVDG